LFFLLDQKERKNQGFEIKASESCRDQPKPGETRLSPFAGFGYKGLKHRRLYGRPRQLSECFSFEAGPIDLQYSIV